MRSRIKSVSSAAVVLLGITLGIKLQGAAAQDRLLQDTVEFTGAVLFLKHKVPGLVIGAIRGPERAVSGFGEQGGEQGSVLASKPCFVLAPSRKRSRVRSSHHSWRVLL